MLLPELLIAEATEYEFKSALEVKKAKNWLKTISAFSNGIGGSIYFGMSDAEVVEGLEDIQEVSEKISQLIGAKIEPMVHVNMIPYDIEGKKVLRVEVPSGSMTPYYYSSDGNKIAYIRMGEASVQAPSHILTELILKGQNESFDAMFSKYSKNDFSFSILEATYKQRTHKKIIDSDYVSFGLANEQGKLTYVGVLSSDQCPLLQSRTFCTRWNGLTMGSIFDDAIDDKEYEGNIFTVLDNTKQFIRNNSKVRWRKTPDGRIDMPDYDTDAIHEAVVNALVHRSYLLPGTEVHIDMYDDRLEIVSPGGMFNGKKIQELDLWKIPSGRRNPVLADLFQRMKLMERRGSGIKKILEIHQGKKPPEFQSTETDFVTIFYNENYQKQALEVEKEVLKGKKEVLKGKKEVLEGKKEVLEGKKEVLEGKKEVLEGKKEALEGKKEVLEGKKEALEGKKEVLKVKKEALEGKKEVLKVKKEALEGKKEVLKVKKEALKGKKEVLKAKKEVFDNLVSNMDGNTRTEENAYRIIAEFVMGETFARQDVMDVLGITKTPAGKLMQKMLRVGLIIPMPATGRGKYCINQEI